ncbi:hypothetical protein [Nonomuraea endophytica]|uniref:Uncharacterized protein n=1 Tax=Nonomuraea endophytica TaxID=714136 RepID=A0A7W8ELM3_9ACTN|nr:hypothetical protein [Nonomuraea endophytica]MBB5084054.1 hypothetical protein [Nonomuraea endophytica]
MIAGILALLTAAMLAWFALHNVVYAIGPTGGWSSVVLLNVAGGLISAVVVLVPAGFTFARRIPGAWTLCALCALYSVTPFVMAPLLFGTAFDVQLTFLFAFDEGDSIAIALAIIFAALTAIMAAIAGSTRSHRPTTTHEMP